MPDAKHDGDELEKDIDLTEDPKDDLDTGKDTDGELFDSEQDGGKDLDLEVEEPKKEAKPDRNANKQKQIDAWLGKLLNNEATIDELPENLKWMKTPLLKEMKALEVAPDVEHIVEKKLREKEEAMEFAHMKAKLNAMGLSKSEREELSSEFKDLAKAGLNKQQALSKAMKIVGVQFDSHDRDVEDLKRAMAVPKGGVAPREVNTSDPETVLKKFKSSKDRIEHWEKIRKAGRM